ncbi:hypothetical protein BDW74DRAFT_174047 [Aspergillus multicolor]|uniref:oxidase ustYa family protein n=1 Tax=Aspergillus multicolor TaxID=41759 RepID=UPI003CCE4C00
MRAYSPIPDSLPPQCKLTYGAMIGSRRDFSIFYGLNKIVNNLFLAPDLYGLARRCTIPTETLALRCPLSMEKYSTLKTDDRDSAESLLRHRDETSFDNVDAESFAQAERNSSWLSRHKTSIFLSLFFLAFNLISCSLVYTWLQHRYSHYPFLGNTPARNVIRYEGQQLDLLPVYLPDGTLNPDKPGHFNGKPTPELAESWKSIMQHQNIRLQRHELGPFAQDESVIELADGSGYFATLAVFHGLHCLKRFHHYIHRDSYYPNTTAEDEARLLYHTGELYKPLKGEGKTSIDPSFWFAEHCVDWLRQYVQCNADTTLIPFYWGAGQTHPLAVDKAEHQCVKWEPLEHWMAEHSFDAFQQGLLVHPLYGDPYTGQKPDTIGIAVGDHPLEAGHEGH